MIKKILILLLVLLLSSCLRPEFVPPEAPQTPEPPQGPVSKPATQPLPTLPVKTVSRDETIHYGYDEENRLVSVVTPKENITLIYAKNQLTEVLGPTHIQYHYQDEQLTHIIEDGNTQPLFYDEHNRLLEYQADENLHFTHDGDKLTRVRRGVAGTTSIDHNDHGISALTRGSVRTAVGYDDKNRLRIFDGGDTHLVLGYWRDNKLIKLTGNTIGQGIEVSYGPEPTPTRAQIISEDDETTFTAPETAILYDTVDRYLYCTYIRRLPILFEGISYTIYTTYENKTLQDYLITNTLCEVL